jgi:hypothetical protein
LAFFNAMVLQHGQMDEVRFGLCHYVARAVHVDIDGFGVETALHHAKLHAANEHSHPVVLRCTRHTAFIQRYRRAGFRAAGTSQMAGFKLAAKPVTAMETRKTLEINKTNE